MNPCPGPVEFGDQGIEVCLRCGDCICCPHQDDPDFYTVDADFMNCERQTAHENSVRLCWLDSGECALAQAECTIRHDCAESRAAEAPYLKLEEDTMTTSSPESDAQHPDRRSARVLRSRRHGPARVPSAADRERHGVRSQEPTGGDLMPTCVDPFGSRGYIATRPKTKRATCEHCWRSRLAKFIEWHPGIDAWQCSDFADCDRAIAKNEIRG